MKTTLIPKAKVTAEHQMLALACVRRLGGWDNSAEMQQVAQMWAEYEAAIRTDVRRELEGETDVEQPKVQQFLLTLS